MYQSSYREDNVFSRYRGISIESCLIAGLGELELIPKWITQEHPDCILDVVESDKKKITKLNIPVIYESIFEYTPKRNYDLIIMDIWYCGTTGYREEIEFLKTKFSSYLNENGLMSFPMIDMHTIYSYVELQRTTNRVN